MFESIIGLLTLISVACALLLWRSYLPAYAAEKAKNLATREDVQDITRRVEEVKTLYATQIKELEHQNALVLERLRADQQLRMAAAEKRLAVHQEAFTLWRKLHMNAHSDQVNKVVLECQEWWEQNCLYLAPQARDSFNRAYFAASLHRQLVQDHSNAESMKANWQLILVAGEHIVSGVELPSLGARESQTAAVPNVAS
jgi:hypothetical protein